MDANEETNNSDNESEEDIASFAFSLHANQPGALLSALSCIAKLDLNLSRIESRPSKRELGEYVFFIDIELSDKVKKIDQLLTKNLSEFCAHLVHFGSFNSSEINAD